MYNHLLDTFKAVAEEGSFLKAAEKIFLTHTAVRKQINDKIRKHIEENFPKIRIVDIPPHYDIQTFNRSAESGFLLLSLECWSRVHPELKMLRLKEKFSLPYGITFLKSSEKMQKFALEIDKAKM